METGGERAGGTGDAGVPACPAGAGGAPGVLDASRWLAHWLQTAGVFPRELRKPLGDRIYGCDDCLDACPPGGKRLRGVTLGVGRVDLLDLLESDDATLLDRYARFYIPRRRPRILRRNAILALGNSWAETGSTPLSGDAHGRDTVFGVLRGYLNDPDEVLRLHSAWAIGRIGGAIAHQLLEARESAERVPQVKEDIDLSLVGLRLSGSS